MKKIMASLFIFAFLVAPVRAGLLDDIKKGIDLQPVQPSGSPGEAENLDEETTVSGLKEALAIGAANAVGIVSGKDGYFANQAIKILLPEKIQKAAELLRAAGYGKQVDEFELSMNRAAETAAPKAKKHIIAAVKAMTFDDARKILSGGDTAATDFFRSKTQDKLFEEFKPIVGQSMEQVGVTLSYREMTSKFKVLPFIKAEALDLDRYVTQKALDGLFYMIAQEEQKIRTAPAARVTELLKTVFGK
ncbi:MAG: DUF4197 domain-containing protein [Deltaproteobacteria bacterium]|nr:DUF4197 domain-containing protein [Deltaproteobacteria bacterium]